MTKFDGGPVDRGTICTPTKNPSNAPGYMHELVTARNWKMIPLYGVIIMLLIGTDN